MKKDIILCGVGGQGILSIATVIAQAATATGINLKQAEVHGMSQRGGDVQSHLRLSTDEIWSDLIPKGKADLVISMEPMESLRYLEYLSADATVISSSTPFVNIPNYPDEAHLESEIKKLPSTITADIEEIAKSNNMPKGANMVLLGMAASKLEIISPEALRDAIGSIFARKGEEIVDANKKAFDLGMKAAKNEL